MALCDPSVIPPKEKARSLFLLPSKSNVSAQSRTAVLTESHRDSSKLIIRFDSHVIIVNNGTGDVPTTSRSLAASLDEKNCSLAAGLQTKFDIKGRFVQEEIESHVLYCARLHNSLDG